MSENGFKKYPKIENSYSTKNIEKFFSKFPELKEEKMVVLEKLDGANISVICYPDGSHKIGKRSGIIEDENFYGIWNVIDKYEYENVINHFKKMAIQNNSTIVLYGELHGTGIQKRINYGPDKYIRFFDVMINGKIQPFYKWVDILQKFDVCVPILYKDISLDDALKIDVESSELSNSEGIIIKPFYKEYYLNNGKRFILKKKSEKFSEKSKRKKKKKNTNKEISDEVKKLRKEFERYINRNRVLSCYSKIGEIESEKQISDYIRYILSDAKEDFFDDGNDLSNLSKDETKFVFNVSGMILKYLREDLNK